MTDWHASPAVPPLAALDVHVWMAHVPQLALLQPKLQTVLSDLEQRAAHAYYFAEDTTRYVVAHACTRLLLGAYTQSSHSALAFATGNAGKPALTYPPTDIHFNISHSADRILLGFARGGEVGVDVERIRTDAGQVDMDRVAALVFSDREQLALSHAHADQRSQRFYAMWTRKESYIKATGVGISKGLDWFSVSHQSGDARLLADDTNPLAVSAWKMQEVFSDEWYVAAVTYDSSLRTPQLFTLNAQLLQRLCAAI